MSGREKVDEELEITARPKSMTEEVGYSSPVSEVGLSIDPEDLGRQFLSGATEQHNFESSRGGDATDLYVNSAAPTDDALTGPNFEGDHTVWENTVSLAMQSGGPEGAQAAVSQVPVDDDDESQDDGLRTVDPLGADVDLTEPVIQEASLLDHEAEVLGETTAPGVRSDDSRSHAKKRGGHAPKGARQQPRSR